MLGFFQVGHLRTLSGSALCRIFLAGIFSLSGFFAQAQTTGTVRIDETDRISFPGNVQPRANALNDIGRVKPEQPMEKTILVLNLRPGAQSELDQLIAEQHNPASPLYHHWLTPEEFGQRFGINDQQLAAVAGWLLSHGFKIDEIAKGRNWINFSGNAAQVEQAFQTEMHQYLVNGEVHQANSSNPSIPRGLMPLVRGIASLHDFRSHPMHAQFRTQVVQPDLNLGGGGHAVGPTDFAIIYDLSPLFSQGIDGTGQTIAVVGRSNIVVNDVTTFRSFFALPVNDPVVIVNGTDPGTADHSEEGEADLDVEWAGAVAPRATIRLVTSKSTGTSDGANLSAQYIVNNNVAPVMTMSFGLCESALGSGGNAFFNSLWQQAASEGITAFISSGDSGAAECDAQDASTGTSVAVSGISSTPYDIAVGGSEFNEGTGTYWKTPSDPGTHASALGYIPEVAWNESGSNGGTFTGLHSSGGGASTVYSKPSYQVAPGVPADGRRDVPDVSLTAAAHDGYVVCQADTTATCVTGSSGTPLAIVSGTSASTPAFAGIMALVVQKTGQRQGVANMVLYPMANNQYANGGVAAFHDVTSGNNTVPGITGFNCGPGYDQVTGLGSVDATLLVNNWGSMTLPTSRYQVSAPGAATFGVAFSITVTAQDVNGNTTPAYTGRVHFSSTDAQAILPADYTFVAGDNGVHTFTVTLRTLGNQTVTATDTVTNSITGTSAAITVNPGPATHYVLTGAPANIAAGISFNITVTAQDSFNNTATGYRGAVHFTSSDGQASLPSDYFFTAGDNGAHTFSFILGTLGSQTVTGTDKTTGSITGTSSGITVNPGATAHFRVQPSASSITASNSSNLNVTVTAQDAYNNTTPAYGGTVHFTCGDPQAVLPGNSALSSGAGTFPVTLKTAGVRVIIATDAGASSIAGTSSFITISAAAAKSFSWSVPATATVGTAFSATLTAFDSFNNVATSYTGSVQLSKTGTPTVTVPGTYTFTTGAGNSDNGAHTFANGFTVTAGTQGNTFTLTGNDAGNSITATSLSITVTNDAAIVGVGRMIHMFRPKIPMLIASFTDADGSENGNNYTATLNWGDGNTDSGCTLASTNCKIVRQGSSNVFNVMGMHTYAKKKIFTVVVTLTDSNGGAGTGSVATANSTVRFLPVGSSH